MSAATTTRERPTVLLSCLNGFSVRYLLRTDILTTLRASGARIVVLFGGADDPEFVREFASDGVILRRLRNDAYADYEAQHPFTQFLKLVKRFTLNGDYDTTTIDAFFRLHVLRGNGLRQRLYLAVQRAVVFALKRSGWLRRALVALENRWYAPAVHEDVFAEFKPDVVVVTTLGYLDYDYYVMREGRRHGARLVSVILSWDNPTSKGIGGVRADHVIAWTDNMKRELVELHEYEPSQVSVGGVAHFDDYVRPGSAMPRQDFDALFSLDASRRTIFFAGKSPSAYPWNPELIETLAQAAEDGRFGEPCQVIARVHPAQFVKKHAVVGTGRSVQDVNWQRYEELLARYPLLRFSVPKIRVGSAFDIDRDEALILTSLLTYSDVVVNCFSTINLEGAILDRPLVNVGFNGTGLSPSRNPRHDILFDERQTHNNRVAVSGGVRIARNPAELVAMVAEALTDPGRDRGGRRRLVETECGGTYLGRAGRRVAELILEQASASGRGAQAA